MKNTFPFLLSVFCILSFYSNLSAQDYPSTSAKDFNADAPWRVKSLDSKIPIIMTIKDANLNDCLVDTIQIWIYDKINNRDSLIHINLFGGILINIYRWEYLLEISVNDLTAPPYNLTISEFDTLTFHLRLSFRDGFTNQYFTQYLKVFVGASGFPSFTNWYSGDTHFHSEFTNNKYEFGATIKTTSKTTTALGLDWITITDHSCDFPPSGVVGFNPLFSALQDSITKYNLDSSCLLIRGEEVTIDNDNTPNAVDDKIHLLVYNKSNFIRGPENWATGTNDNSGDLTFLNDALTQNFSGIAYAAHPWDKYEKFLVGDLIGDLKIWCENNLNDAFLHRDNFRGLEFWNTKQFYVKNVNDDFINPFPFDQSSDNKMVEYKEHLDSAEFSWMQMLRDDLYNFTSDKKLFGMGGSDAHGDFNYQTYIDAPQYLNPNIWASDNAIAKVRTLAYLPNGKNLDNVLFALKNGNTILSDGPVVIFDIDINGDGVIDSTFGEDAHIGDDKICNYSSIDSNKIKIYLKWNNTNEFGGDITRFVLHYITHNVVREFVLNGHFGINDSKFGSTWISLKDLETVFNFSYKLDEYSLFKFVAYTQDSLYRCYTNPIWLKIESPIGVNVQMTVLLEGFYNTSTQLMNCADTIRVELRTITSPYNKIDSSVVLINTAGQGVAKFKFAETGDYYLVLRHRNSIETWSKIGGEHFVKGTSTSYDFTSNNSQAFGNNMKLVGSKWCIYGGDVNQDGLVDLSDLSLTDVDNLNYVVGYTVTDVNGDGIVDLSDITLIDNNNFNFVSVIKPYMSGGVPCANTPTVSYAGKTYHTVQIGNQCWLKENLDVGTMISGSSNQTNNGLIEKYCYSNNTANCNTYGGLYQWNEAMQYVTTQGAKGICPNGWHIPTLAELEALRDAVGGNGNKLKREDQGIGAGQGTNESGFSALLAGYRDYDGNFYELNSFAYFWSSTERSASGAYSMQLTYGNSAIYLSSYYGKAEGLSVRCLKD